MNSKGKDLINLYPTTHKGRCELIRFHYVKITLELAVEKIVPGSELDSVVREYMKERREPDYLVALYQLYVKDPSILKGWDEDT